MKSIFSKGWVLFVLFSAVLINCIFTFVLQPVTVSGKSMYPTYHDKQYGFSLKFKPALDTIERFDVVVIQNEETEGNYWIKRVIGLPGDYLKFKDNQLYINGEKVKEGFLDEDWVKQNLEEFGFFTNDFEIQLTEDEYFVMGDNRPYSSDSRVIGPVQKEDITSKYVFRVPMT